MIGTKLGHYEITTHLGSGGMGDVYQAIDTKLGRSVAIKFLPEAFSHDTERVARFQREARVLASLNHSNIAAIYGVEEIDNRHFLVMELVSGETLADRIKRGAIPIEEALPIAKQIAEALEEAHDKGIIHRDLKPANIKLTPDGKVKVLDFGLAKAYDREQASPLVSNSPTISMAATNAGVILGTAAYMSPEQAKGRAVDRRTDLFAFGCILYEMLTGRPAFNGDDVAEILARVIEREPDWNRLPLRTPPGIRRLLELCLEKDRNRRLQTAADARIRIEESAREQVPLPLGEGAAKRRVRVEWFAAILIIAAFLTVPTVRHLRETEPPETRVDIVTPATTDPVSFALSPDGRQIVFVASGDGAPRLWLRPLDKATAQPLAGTESATQPFWSPDSKSVGFFTGNTLKRIDLGGGLPQKLADVSATPRGGAWSPEGVILFQPTTGGGAPLLRIPASGGESTVVTRGAFPQFLPGGRQFLFNVLPGLPGADSGIYLGSLDARQSKPLTPVNTAGFYAPPDWLLYIRQGTLVAQRFDRSRGEITAEPVTIADPVRAVSVSATGLIAYRTGQANRQQLLWFDRSGKMLSTLGTSDNTFRDPDLSPDGAKVAVDGAVDRALAVWILTGVRDERFTFAAETGTQPIWSPDGTQIVYASAPRNGVGALYLKPSNGAGGEQQLIESPGGKNPSDWSADGRFILYYTGEDEANRRDLWILPLQGNRKPSVFLKTRFNEGWGKFSPDGRWVAYASDESGRFEIYVRPFPGPAGQWQVSTSGGIQPQWRRDGKELYYLAPDNYLMAVPIGAEGATFEPGSPVALFQTKANNQTRQQYDVAPDGRFLINVTTEDSAAAPITLIQNWRPPAK